MKRISQWRVVMLLGFAASGVTMALITMAARLAMMVLGLEIFLATDPLP